MIPWKQANSNGELPGSICCQRATGELCYEHDPLNYIGVKATELELKEKTDLNINRIVQRHLESLYNFDDDFQEGGVPFWSIVANQYSVGSTTASLMCRFFGFDPDKSLEWNPTDEYCEDEEYWDDGFYDDDWDDEFYDDECYCLGQCTCPYGYF